MAASPASSAAAAAAAAEAVLGRYTACDVADALLRLQVPRAGFVADLRPYGRLAPAGGSVTIAPVSSVLFAAKGQPPPPGMPTSNIPPGSHWADVTPPGSFVLLQQPDGQTNAVCGGIVALRIKARGARGIAVAGRVRDLAELRSTGLPILAYGSSVVGAGGGSLPWALQVPLDVGGVRISPGDIAFCDDNGLVVIPRDKLDQVLELLPRLTAADDRVKDDVRQGMALHDAFARHRGA